MSINLRLDEKGYADALTAVRHDNDHQDSVEVVYVDENDSKKVSRYFLKSPNFELNAYEIGGSRYDLKSYRHVGKFPGVSNADLVAALSKGGEGGTDMNQRLSVVVCLICEAARSKLIEGAMQRAIAGERVELEPYRVLMNMYEHTLRFKSTKFKGTTQAAPPLLPLQLQDYIDYVQSKDYTGDTGIADTIRALN
ncbi:hypothetical protein ACDH70_03855 [Xanthomonas axonopodis pv. poinsettiicola]|uniref:hypothetical protein n=1 Tax=Xanthomonas TaxID=338 RepID=UPI001E3164AD|nr:hypothetical protein [Xanthomonas codiaei]MCC8537115.1 hypothetical protein [Xanthomonas codiaei]